MPQWPVPSSNSILVGGLPLFHEYEASETIYPGMVVSFTANLGAGVAVTVRPCGFGEDPVGVALKAMADQTGRGSWMVPGCTGAESTTKNLPYLTGDQVKVVSGDVFVMLILDEEEDLVPGDKVQCSNSTHGYVEEFYCDGTTSDPCDLVAESLEKVTSTTGECEYFLAKLLI